MSIDLLKDDIKAGKIRNLYLFYGQEEYLKKFYLGTIEDSIITEDFKALNKVVLEGKVDQKAIIDCSETLPVFSEKKLVIVKNSGIFKAKKKAEEGGAKSKASNDDLLSYIPNIPDFTCLIFYEAEADKRMKLVDAVKKNGLVVEFPYQKPMELVKWVVKVFRSYKKEVDPDAASLIVDYSEQGMTEILNEVNKLSAYLGDREKVTVRDVETVCTKSVKGKIFDLTDAISEKNDVRALKLLNDMIMLKEPVPKILFMIARQFRHILEMKLLKSEGISTNDAAARIGITPYAAGKIQKQAGSFSVDMLKKAIRESLELDLAIKTGKINDRIAAELLITSFASK